MERIIRVEFKRNAPYVLAEPNTRESFVRNVIAPQTKNKSVIAAFESVDRAKFVPRGLLALAYEDKIVELGDGSSVSQPTLTALMTDYLNLGGNEIVLEVGTGSGYSAAILSRCASVVHTIEKNPRLAKNAAQRLKKLGYWNVKVHKGDGLQGIPDAGMFDAISVTGGLKEAPKELLDQLAVGGKLVAPVGSHPSYDSHLTVFKKESRDRISQKSFEQVSFYPIISESSGGWKKVELENLPEPAEIEINKIGEYFKISSSEVYRRLGNWFGIEPEDKKAIHKRLDVAMLISGSLDNSKLGDSSQE